MVRFGFAIAMIIGLGGCAASGLPGEDDSGQVLHALSATLTADGAPACIDNWTQGAPLTAYRAMMAAPARSRQPLAWHEPQPLRPPTLPSGRRIFNDELRSDQILLLRPQQTGAPLSFLLQRQLNFAANRLSLMQGSKALAIEQWPGAPLAHPRWWILNRLWPVCSAVYAVSNPVVAKNVAFVSVKAGHWGTTYAFVKQGSQWKAIGQWTNWLY
jgi:hypothetical protein